MPGRDEIVLEEYIFGVIDLGTDCAIQLDPNVAYRAGRGSFKLRLYVDHEGRPVGMEAASYMTASVFVADGVSFVEVNEKRAHSEEPEDQAK